jgi:hypothetical protein
MEAIDDLIADTQEIARRFGGPLEHEDRVQLAHTAITNWGDVIANLKRFTAMSAMHLAGKYLELTQKTYDTKAYEEP